MHRIVNLNDGHDIQLCIYRGRSKFIHMCTGREYDRTAGVWLSIDGGSRLSNHHKRGMNIDSTSTSVFTRCSVSLSFTFTWTMNNNKSNASFVTYTLPVLHVYIPPEGPSL